VLRECRSIRRAIENRDPAEQLKTLIIGQVQVLGVVISRSLVTSGARDRVEFVACGEQILRASLWAEEACGGVCGGGHGAEEEPRC